MHWVPMTNWTYGEVRSDNAYKGGGGVNDGDFCTLLETFKIDATWSNADEKWFQLYCCLQRCNSALRVMNTLDENALPMIKSRKAEMKVIRAHFFFELVRLFKQVPYFDENVENDDYKYIPTNIPPIIILLFKRPPVYSSFFQNRSQPYAGACT